MSDFTTETGDLFGAPSAGESAPSPTPVDQVLTTTGMQPVDSIRLQAERWGYTDAVVVAIGLGPVAFVRGTAASTPEQRAEIQRGSLERAEAAVQRVRYRAFWERREDLPLYEDAIEEMAAEHPLPRGDQFAPGQLGLGESLGL